ncbi:GNAT family N-acetyltransferase [Feifania hominis]|uniref:GNAT family N-acetyltransferase n=1 Tax=Feifania hominis TaxID=2763660 RepID=UPI0020164BF6
MNLETERLVLRPFDEGDVEAYHRIMSDLETNRFLPWYPTKSLDEARTMMHERAPGDGGLRYAICLKDDLVPIGYVHVSGSDNHDFGYGLRHEFWHRGIVTEASLAVVDQLRKDGLAYITATHDVNNPRSGAVMRKLGMHYCYSYEEQWQPKNIPVVFRLYQRNFDGVDRVWRKYWEQYENHFIEKIEERP